MLGAQLCWHWHRAGKPTWEGGSRANAMPSGCPPPREGAMASFTELMARASAFFKPPPGDAGTVEGEAAAALLSLKAPAAPSLGEAEVKEPGLSSRPLPPVEARGWGRWVRKI